MNDEELPKALQAKTPGGLLKRHFIKRMTAEHFHEKNDHNPSIAKSCPKCNERGFIRTLSKGDSTCEKCNGYGYLEIERKLFEFSFFDGRQRLKKIEPNTNGAVKCPACNKSFKISSDQHWSGLRHTCGQKLKLLGKNASLCHTKNN